MPCANFTPQIALWWACGWTYAYCSHWLDSQGATKTLQYKRGDASTISQRASWYSLLYSVLCLVWALLTLLFEKCLGKHLLSVWNYLRQRCSDYEVWRWAVELTKALENRKMNLQCGWFYHQAEFQWLWLFYCLVRCHSDFRCKARLVYVMFFLQIKNFNV